MYEELLAVREIGEYVLLKTKDFVLLPIFELFGEEAGIEILRRRVGNKPRSIGSPLNSRLDGRKYGFSRKKVNTTINQVRDV